MTNPPRRGGRHPFRGARAGGATLRPQTGALVLLDPGPASLKAGRPAGAKYQGGGPAARTSALCGDEGIGRGVVRRRATASGSHPAKQQPWRHPDDSRRAGPGRAAADPRCHLVLVCLAVMVGSAGVRSWVTTVLRRRSRPISCVVWVALNPPSAGWALSVPHARSLSLWPLHGSQPRLARSCRQAPRGCRLHWPNWAGFVVVPAALPHKLKRGIESAPHIGHLARHRRDPGAVPVPSPRSLRRARAVRAISSRGWGQDD